jgi:hypothetical protein
MNVGVQQQPPPAERRTGGGSRRGGGQPAATSPRFRGLTLVNRAFVNPVYGRDIYDALA